MTYTGMFEDAQLSSKLKEAKKEIQRQKRYIEKQVLKNITLKYVIERM